MPRHTTKTAAIAQDGNLKNDSLCEKALPHASMSAARTSSGGEDPKRKEKKEKEAKDEKKKDEKKKQDESPSAKPILSPSAVLVCT